MKQESSAIGWGSAFLDTLLGTSVPSGTFDPWHDTSHDDASQSPDAIRREHLHAHFSVRAPCLLLVGEAPGYQGCRISGVAFTSERLLMEGRIPRIPRPARRLSTRRLPWSEPSATIIWGALEELGVAETTLLWNAFPWHPWNPAKGPLSNRTPTAEERATGLEVLQVLLETLPPGVRVAAVGKTAAASLEELGCHAPALRHPANGGATLFRQGLRNLLQQPSPRSTIP